VTSVSAFIGTKPSVPFITQESSKSVSTSQLYISSWGAGGPPSRRKVEEPDPEQKIQSYLKEPQPVAARNNLDGAVLVSGWVKTQERTDQTVFDFLNNEESAFQFEKIIAFVNDAKFAKKRLISRSARYTGLLDKLDFIQAESTDALPTYAQLEGVKSWLAYAGNDLSVVRNIAAIAQTVPSIENICVLITDAQTLSAAESLEAVQSLSLEGKSFTVVAVGSITEEAEGTYPYEIKDFGTTDGVLVPDAKFSRDESLRLVTECLGLECGINKAFTFAEVNNVNQTEYKLVKGLREGGYTRPQEIDHMITKGAVAYENAIEDYRTRVPRRTEEDDWLAAKQRELDENAEERKAKIKEEFEAKKQAEIEEIAREWAKREFYRKSMSGDMPYSEEEYIKSVWERALFEGDLKYRMLRGQDTDERKELAEFKEVQEKKKAAMLARAKAGLEDLLNDDDDSSE